MQAEETGHLVDRLTGHRIHIVVLTLPEDVDRFMEKEASRHAQEDTAHRGPRSTRSPSFHSTDEDGIRGVVAIRGAGGERPPRSRAAMNQRTSTIARPAPLPERAG